jgi:organic hydroperoxide reductase OsmC/OhrA
MPEHLATISWQRGDAAFTYDTYPRNHVWRFENGLSVEASSALHFLGDASRVDPEEAFVASLASCHMLTFLTIAARKRLAVDRYEDRAVGVLEKNEQGRLAITRVRLRPDVTFADPDAVSQGILERLHEQAHQHCFIANSVRTRIEVETRR